VVEDFKTQKLDFAMDVATLQRLCPDLEPWRCERIVSTLSFTPRLMLMNSMTFLLLLITLSDAREEVCSFFAPRKG